MDTAQWPQEIVVKPMEEIIVPNTCSSATACSNIIAPNTTTNNNNKGGSSTSLERKVRPQKDQALNCPRCNSTNTKFCYYNNYSLTQPRYFCKTCRRYWTEGGSLRNIPVGGGSRKNKRSSSSSTSSNSSCSNSASKKQISDHLLIQQSHFTTTQNPKILPHQGQDLNLGFPPTHHQDQFRSLSEFIQLPSIESTTKPSVTSTTNNTSSASNLSAMELLNGLTSSRGLMTPFMPMPVSDPNGHVYSSGGFGLQDFKPSLSFSLDGLGNGNGYGGLQGGVQVQVQQQEESNNVGRLLFPFEDLKQQETSADHNNNQKNNNNSSNNTTNEQTRDQQGDSTGYWSGMLGTTGGSW